MATDDHHTSLVSLGSSRIPTSNTRIQALEIEAYGNPTNTTTTATTTTTTTTTTIDSTRKIITFAFAAIIFISVVDIIAAICCSRALFASLAICMTIGLKIHIFHHAEDGLQRTREGVYTKTYISKNDTFHHMSKTPFWVGFVLVLWSGLNYHLPIFQRATLFQEPLWKWSFLAAALTSIYSWTIFYSKPWLFVTFQRLQERVQPISFPWCPNLFYGLLIHLSHFGQDLDNVYFRSVLPIGIGVAVLVRMCIGLFLVERRVIHKRFRERIQMAGFQYFFLSLFIERIEIRPVLPCWCEYRGGSLGCPSFACYKSPPLDSLYDIEYSIRQLVRMPVTPCIAKIDQICQERFREDSEDAQVYVTKELLLKSMDEECADILIQLLQEELLCDDITCEALQQWMVDAHINCWYLGSTLNCALEFMRMCVILSCATTLVVIAALIWLRPTNITPLLIWIHPSADTTPMVVGLAVLCSLVALFFQDIIKTSLRVLLFLFVNRNYSIGDLCIIEDKEVHTRSTT